MGIEKAYRFGTNILSRPCNFLQWWVGKDNLKYNFKTKTMFYFDDETMGMGLEDEVATEGMEEADEEGTDDEDEE